MISFFEHSTLRIVALGAASLGAVGGALGTFAVLRRQSLLGDAVSHAALPGVVIAYMITHSKAPLVLLAGAAIAGWLGARLVALIVRRSRVPFDSALGLVLAVFFGLGLVLLTALQKTPDARQAGLDRYLFGSAATLLWEDVLTIMGVGAATLFVVMLLWKEFELLAFDPQFASALGYRVAVLDAILSALLVIAIVVGLQTVGVVLMSSLIIAPAAAARPWVTRLGPMVIVSGIIGSISGVVGVLVSENLNVPTGPSIVLAATAFVVTSFVLQSMRKLLARRRARSES